MKNLGSTAVRLQKAQDMLKAATRIRETTRSQLAYLKKEFEAQTEVVASLNREVHELTQELKDT